MAEQDLLFSYRVMRHSHGCLLRVFLTLLSYKGTNKIMGVVDDKRRAIVRADSLVLGSSRQRGGRPINWMGTLAAG